MVDFDGVIFAFVLCEFDFRLPSRAEGFEDNVFIKVGILRFHSSN